MTREEKQRVALALMQQAGNLIEFWEQRFEDVGERPPCDAEEARVLIAKWLQHLPGDNWDTRLGTVN